MPTTAAILVDTTMTEPSLPSSSPFSGSTISPEASPEHHPVKRLSPSLSPVISDHQLPTLGALSRRSSIPSISSDVNVSFPPRILSPPLRAVHIRSKSCSSFPSTFQEASSLPVLMKPYRTSPAATASPLLSLADSCSLVSTAAYVNSLPPLHPRPLPAVSQLGGGGLRPRARSLNAYEYEEARSQRQHGYVTARLRAMRAAQIAEQPAGYITDDTCKWEEQPLVELNEGAESEADD